MGLFGNNGFLANIGSYAFPILPGGQLSGDKNSTWNNLFNGSVTGGGWGQFVGSIDGATSAQKALDQSTAQFNIAQTQAAQLIAQNQANNENAQKTSSNNAASMTATAKATSGPNPFISTPLALGPSNGNGAPNSNNKDFLGL